jgi:hypothetical protein
VLGTKEGGMVKWTWVALMGAGAVVGCGGGQCDDGYALANDGRCYPTEAGDDDDDDDDDGPGVEPTRPREDTGRFARGDDTGRSSTTTASRTRGGSPFYLGEPQLLSLQPSCLDGALVLGAEAMGLVAVVEVDIVVTGGFPVEAQRVALQPELFEPFGWYTALQSPPVEGMGCELLDDEGVTWVVRLDDGVGDTVCEVFGHDVAGLLEGAHRPTRPVRDLGDCVRGAL